MVIPTFKSVYLAESVSESSCKLIWVGAYSSKYRVMKTNKFLLTWHVIIIKVYSLKNTGSLNS